MRHRVLGMGMGLWAFMEGSCLDRRVTVVNDPYIWFAITTSFISLWILYLWVWGTGHGAEVVRDI